MLLPCQARPERTVLDQQKLKCTYALHCHVSCILLFRYRILRLGCSMARRKETTIERIYREVTGNKMPAAVKRVLLPSERSSGTSGLAPWKNWECQAMSGLKHLLRAEE